MKTCKYIFAALGVALFFSGCSIFRGDNVTYYRNLKIREDLLEKNEYNVKYKYGSPMKVEYVTIHNTANTGPAVNERAYLNNRRDNQYLSFHFAVDETEAVQILPLDIGGWHAGDGRGKGNRSSIGIEICRSRCSGVDDWRYRKAEDNGVLLAAYLLKKFNLPVSALRTHKDWSGKNCPHRILDEKRWDSFRQRVAAAMR